VGDLRILPSVAGMGEFPELDFSFHGRKLKYVTWHPSNLQSWITAPRTHRVMLSTPVLQNSRRRLIPFLNQLASKIRDQHAR